MSSWDRIHITDPIKLMGSASVYRDPCRPRPVGKTFTESCLQTQMALLTLVVEIYPDGPNKVFCGSTPSSRSGRIRPILLKREVGSSSPTPLCRGSIRTPTALSSCSGALMLRRRAVPLIGSGTTCCRPHAPHRCREQGLLRMQAFL